MIDDKPIQPSTIQIIASPPPDDEISLWELWDRIWRGKWTISLVTLLFVALAGAYLATRTSIYQSEALVQISQLGGKPLENANTLAARLYNSHRPVNTLEAKKQLPRLHGVSVEKGDESVLSLVTYGKSPAEAQSYLQGIINSIDSDDQGIYKAALQLRQDQLKELQSRYDALTKEASDSTTTLSALTEGHRRESTAATLLQEIFALQNSLLPSNTHPAQIVRKPSYDPETVSIKGSIVLVLAFLGGLFTGVFVVLIRDAIRARPSKALELDGGGSEP